MFTIAETFFLKICSYGNILVYTCFAADEDCVFSYLLVCYWCSYFEDVAYNSGNSCNYLTFKNCVIFNQIPSYTIWGFFFKISENESISRWLWMFRHAPLEPIDPYICVLGAVADVIICAKFRENVSKGFGAVRPRKTAFPIEIVHRPYNSKARICNASLATVTMHMTSQRLIT